MLAATFFDGVGWHDGIIATDGERMLLRDEPPAPDLPRLDGVVIGGFTDHHVHLQLVDHTLLSGSMIGRVVDLGANPTVVAALAGSHAASAVPLLSARGEARDAPALRGEVEGASGSARSGAFSTPQHTSSTHTSSTHTSSTHTSSTHTSSTPHRVAVEFAGAFLTPVGGYPSDRTWAPAGSCREIADSAAAETAVAEMADAGASCIKVASNLDAGPVFDDAQFRAIVAAAAARGLPVVAHAEGSGQAQRAARLGAAFLAHAPFSDRLDDDEIGAQASSVSWISTLDIHDGDTRTTAVDNVRRFHAAGGTVLYGTDMGNGPTPIGLNAGELAALRDAGITGTDLLRTLTPQDPRDPASILLRLAGTDADPTLARPLTSADLKA